MGPGILGGVCAVLRVGFAAVHRPHEAVTGALVDIDLLDGLAGLLEGRFELADAGGFGVACENGGFEDFGGCSGAGSGLGLGRAS